MDYNPPGSSVYGVFQARILEWVAIPFSRGSSPPRDQTQVSCIAGGFFTIWAPRKGLIGGAWKLPGPHQFIDLEKITFLQEPFREGGVDCLPSEPSHCLHSRAFIKGTTDIHDDLYCSFVLHPLLANFLWSPEFCVLMHHSPASVSYLRPPTSAPSSSGFPVILSPPVRELTSVSWVALSVNSLRAEKFRALDDKFLSFKKSSSSQNTLSSHMWTNPPNTQIQIPRGSEDGSYWGLRVVFKTQGFLVKVEWRMGLASGVNLWLLSLFMSWRWLSLHIRAWLIHSVMRKLRMQTQCWGEAAE